MHFCLFRTLLFLLEVFPSSLWCSGVTGSWVNRPWGLGASPWEVWRGPSVLLLEGLPGNASPAARLLSVGSGVRGGGLPADADFNFTLRLWMYQLVPASQAHVVLSTVSVVQPPKPSRSLQASSLSVPSHTPYQRQGPLHPFYLSTCSTLLYLNVD